MNTTVMPLFLHSCIKKISISFTALLLPYFLQFSMGIYLVPVLFYTFSTEMENKNVIYEEMHTNNINFRLMRNMRAGDVVVCANVRHDAVRERFVQKVGVARFLEMVENDEVFTAMDADPAFNDLSDMSLTVFMVLRPHRGWARVRHVLRVRAIVVYWLFLTEKLMGPDGSTRKRDRDAFEADM